MEDRQKTLNQQLFDLGNGTANERPSYYVDYWLTRFIIYSTPNKDQSGVHLMDNFYKLIGVERGDPEAAAIEHSLLHGPRRQQRRRMRRNYRFVEEYIPPEYAYDYEAEYDYDYEGTRANSPVLSQHCEIYI